MTSPDDGERGGGTGPPAAPLRSRAPVERHRRARRRPTKKERHLAGRKPGELALDLAEDCLAQGAGGGRQDRGRGGAVLGSAQEGAGHDR